MFRKTWLLVLAIAMMHSVSAQTSETLYVCNQQLIDSIAESVVTAYFGKDAPAEKMASYRDAVKSAFVEYWKSKEAQSKVSDAEIQKQQKKLGDICAAIKEIEADSLQLVDSVSVQLQLKSDLAKQQQDLRDSAAPAADGKAIEDERRAMQLDSASLQNLRSQLAALDAELQQKQAVVNELSDQIAQNQMTNDGKQGKLNTLNDDSTPAGRSLALATELATMLDALEQQQQQSVASFDLAALQRVQNELESNGTLIGTVDNQKYVQLKARMQKLQPFAALASSIRKGIEQMATVPFDDKQNASAVKSIQTVKKGLKLSSAQETECKEVCQALTKQNDAFETLNLLLSIVSDECKDGVAKDYDVSEIIKLGVGSDSFSPYYSSFNLVLSELKAKILPGANAVKIVEELKSKY